VSYLSHTNLKSYINRHVSLEGGNYERTQDNIILYDTTAIPSVVQPDEVITIESLTSIKLAKGLAQIVLNPKLYDYGLVSSAGILTPSAESRPIRCHWDAFKGIDIQLPYYAKLYFYV